MKTNISLLVLMLVAFSGWAQNNVFPTSGNVGIGTTNPSQKLSILGNISSQGNSSEGGAIFLENSLKTSPLSAFRWAMYNMTGDYGNSLQFWSYNQGFTDFGPKFSISDNGNVGIGTQNPTSKLEILGQATSYSVGFGQLSSTMSSKNYANFSSNSHGSVLISSNLFVDGNDDLKIARSHATLAGSAILLPGNGMPNQGGITFYTKPASTVSAEQSYAGTANMVILPTGNVGIGTVSPAEKLSVNGKIRSKEIKVEVDNWPDYVFDGGYMLSTLEEVDAHIKKHGRLPEMPSAAQVSANGIDLGEMNRLLLQKIEELTMHLIEKNREIRKSNHRLQEMEVRQAKIENMLKKLTDMGN